MTLRIGLLVAVLVLGFAWTPGEAAAEGITVTLHTSKWRNMNVPLLARDRPARQRRIGRGYVRLLRRAEAVCVGATRRGRASGAPAVMASQTLVNRFDRSRRRLDRLLRRLRLPAAPILRDFSELRHLWVLSRVRRPGARPRVRARRMSTRLSCRFD